ncbi:hypothetical protein DFJ74DRAFT_768432 [Hyaloraphidium curvatum]|nr:hypothetical protein DFJ74DRAFT_768432 [Hyaloraphidium curvatum]
MASRASLGLLLLALALSVLVAGAAARCDPAACERGSRSPRTSRVCDVSCLSPADALFGSKGCDADTACRTCALVGGPKGLKPCRLARLDNFIHSNAQLGNDPTITTALQAEEALLVVVKGLFVEGSPYSLPGIGTFTGSLATAEYLVAIIPAGNFGSFRYARSRILSYNFTSADVLQIQHEITVATSQASFTSVQGATYTFQPGGELATSVVVAVDPGLAQALSSAVAFLADKAQLCGIIQGLCDTQGFQTGYSDSPAPSPQSVADCAAFLIAADAAYQGFSPLSDNTSLCRGLHVVLAQLRPDIHCQHVRKASTVCIT